MPGDRTEGQSMQINAENAPPKDTPSKREDERGGYIKTCVRTGEVDGRIGLPVEYFVEDENKESVVKYGTVLYKLFAILDYWGGSQIMHFEARHALGELSTSPELATPEQLLDATHTTREAAQKLSDKINDPEMQIRIVKLFDEIVDLERHLSGE